VSMLDALSVGVPVEALARYFEFWLLRLEGVYPESRGNLSEAALGFLVAASRVSPRQLSNVPAPPGALRELERVHRRLIGTHLEKTLRSDRVLRDLRRSGSPAQRVQ